MMLQCMGKEPTQCFLRFRHCEAVQVDFGLHPVLAAAKLSQDAVLDPLPGEHELLSACKLRISHAPVQALLEHCKTVGARKTSARWRRWAGLRHGSLLSEGFDVPYGVAEEAGVILIGLGIHASSSDQGPWPQYSDAPYRTRLTPTDSTDA